MSLKHNTILYIFILLFMCSCNDINSNYKIIKITETFKINRNDNKKNDFIKIRIPKDYNKRQDVLKIQYSIRPNKILRENNGLIAYFKIRPIIKELKIEIFMRIYRYDYYNASVETLDESIVDKYLESKYSKKLSKIASESRSITVNNTIDNIITNINDLMIYEIQEDEKSGALGLETGVGDCTEFSDLFVQLCRLNDIPARQIYGYKFNIGPHDLYGYNHAWAEIFLKNKGWIPVETIGDLSHMKQFPEEMNNLVYLGEDIYNGYYYSWSSNLNIEEETIVERIN